MDDASLVYSVAQDLRTGGKEPVRRALLNARGRTLLLADAYADALGNRLARVPELPVINPPLWEIGHVAWFQEWWIARNPQRHRGADCDPDVARPASLLPAADALYDSSRVAHARRWSLPLPDARGTRDYLRATLDATLERLDALPVNASHEDLYFFRLTALHEQMHAEAAVYMARTLGFEVPDAACDLRSVQSGEGVLQLGATQWRLGWDSEGFAFDNELRAHEVSLDAFEIDLHPVSASRFGEFARDGGYENERWWNEPGWRWRQSLGDAWRERCERKGNGPAVHLSLHEARAWCRWAGRRLPSEAEWEYAACTEPGFAWGVAWEWTDSAFLPFAGFEPHPYRDYSAPWFGSRQVLRGASHATSEALAHPKYRNFFEPQRTDIFSGFRSCASRPRSHRV